MTFTKNNPNLLSLLTFSLLLIISHTTTLEDKTTLILETKNSKKTKNPTIKEISPKDPDNSLLSPKTNIRTLAEVYSTEMYTPSSYVKCPSGGIATSTNACTFVQGGAKITCPQKKSILCPDLKCVEKSSQCSSNIPTCPSHKPYKCWNNECRTSFSECPTQVTCPLSAPVYCYTGQCVKSTTDCTVNENLSDDCDDLRCFDGSCVKSIELCPTHTFCGEDAIKCWNGACAEDITNCPPLPNNTCTDDFPYRCPDGSCRPNKKSCSTLSVCPSLLPVKCFDNSCRASTSECPPFQSCGNYKVTCPDGTCALSREACNTVISCPESSPYLCYDNSCKKQLSECPLPPACTVNQVLCPNGECLSSRQNCKVFDACDSTRPIRCEMNTCTDNVDNCSSKTKRCPIGYVACPYGDCKTTEYLCDTFVCPENLPFKCPEGVCVESKDLCDDIETGCPYNANKKCPNGSCVTDLELCEKFVCDIDQKQCPDGSCIEESDECPNQNGCYKDRPFKCADGTCINPETSTCDPVLCPFNTPVKCPNGLCVSKDSDCSIELKSLDLTDCNKTGLIMCADGRCVTSTDYCRPTFECESGYTKCADGTCRVSAYLCPREVQCPSTRPYRCTNQICVKEQQDCINGLLCPEDYVKCQYNGACVKDSNDCPYQVSTRSGCPNQNQVKCENGRCVDSKDDCAKISDACPDDQNPYLSSNGECTDDSSKSSSLTTCESGKEKCDSGRCVKADAKKTECTNIIGCPLNKPYRCSNGQCVSKSNDCISAEISEYEQLISYVACDVSKPYLCDDMSCVSDYSFCKTNQPCSGEKCDNGYCVKEYDQCKNFVDFCPVSAPIKCPGGSCVSNIADCSPAFNIESCDEAEFYCTRLAKCLVNKLECLIYYDISSNNNTRRLFENFINPLQEEKFIYNKLQSFEESTNEKICFDGTIVAESENCPVVPACKMGHYRCPNGACASSLEKCENVTAITCDDDQLLCPDGLCHSKSKNCSDVLFQGCLVGQYQCSNGMCVIDELDCIGFSMCDDPTYPFRCMTGDCKSSPDECPAINRLGKVKEVSYSFNKRNKVSFTFAFDPNKRPIAKLEIPSNGMEINDTTDYSKIYVQEISTSFISDTKLYNDSKDFLFNVSNGVKGSEGVLNVENSVLSPVYKIYTKDSNLKFKMNGLLTITHNVYDTSGLNPYDYCLAEMKGYDMNKDTLNNEDSEWSCVERKSDEEQTEFKVNKFGVYAVILNPLRKKRNYLGDSEEKNFFLENVKTILIVFVVIIVLLVIIFYIFSRVSRYREKYHENRKKILLMQQQKIEYENMTTDIFGQTLGDNMAGIVYKANPCYSVDKEKIHGDVSLEEQIENLQIQIKIVNEQNDRLQSHIDDMGEKTKLLISSIENMGVFLGGTNTVQKNA